MLCLFQAFNRQMVNRAASGMELIRRKQINAETDEPRQVDSLAGFMAAVLGFYGEQMTRLNQRVKQLVMYLTLITYSRDLFKIKTVVQSEFENKSFGFKARLVCTV